MESRREDVERVWWEGHHGEECYGAIVGTSDVLLGGSKGQWQPCNASIPSNHHKVSTLKYSGYKLIISRSLSLLLPINETTCSLSCYPLMRPLALPINETTWSLSC